MNEEEERARIIAYTAMKMPAPAAGGEVSPLLTIQVYPGNAEEMPSEH